jgi:uncharacterized protein
MELAPPAALPPESWPVLDPHERRVLGVLIEKAKTTPDAYPLSLNALVTGCNQKSNRDPVLNLSDSEVESALTGLQKKGLVVRLQSSGRVERWRHIAYEAWRVEKTELAVLAELLLRGPQTEGELRGRASRMEPIEDLDKLRAVLKPLAERRLVVYLTPEGRRGTILTHGFHSPPELERLRAKHAGSGVEPPTDEAIPTSSPAATAPPTEWQNTREEIAALKATVSELQSKVADLAREVQELKAGLGV